MVKIRKSLNIIMDDNSLDSTVNQLISQLNQTTKTAKKVEKIEEPVTKENLEKFLLDNSSRLIRGSVEFVDDIKGFVSSAPTAEEVEALAKLIASSAAAIETLNKVMLANQDGKTKVLLKNMDTDAKVKIKTMDIDSKKQLQQIDMQGKVLMNREELLKKLIDDAKLVEVIAEPAQTKE